MSCRIQARAPRPRPPGLGPKARDPRPETPSQGPQDRAPRLGLPAQGPQASATGPGTPGQGPQARASRSGPPGWARASRVLNHAGLQAWASRLWLTDQVSQAKASRVDRQMDGRTDEQNIPVFCRTMSLWGRCPAHNWKTWKKKKSRARVLLK